MIINKIELEDIDILDVNVAKKVGAAIDEVIEKGNSMKNIKTLSGVIEKQCDAVFECFNKIFGEGTDKKVFGDKKNLRVCLNAFNELFEQIKEQKNEAEKEFNKYSPNRATRRGKR